MESFFSALGARDGAGKVSRGRRGCGRTWARAWRSHPRRLDVVGRMGCICAVRTSCDRCVLHRRIPRRTVDECCLRGRMVVDPRRSHPIGRKSERMPTRNGRNGVEAVYRGTVESSTGVGSAPRPESNNPRRGLGTSRVHPLRARIRCAVVPEPISSSVPDEDGLSFLQRFLCGMAWLSRPSTWMRSSPRTRTTRHNWSQRHVVLRQRRSERHVAYAS